MGTTEIETDREWPPRKWEWTKRTRLHEPGSSVPCDGRARGASVPMSWSADPQRWFGVAWCPRCRDFEANMIFVPEGEEPPDPLALLSPRDRERIERSEIKIVAYLDQLDRRASG